MAKEVFKIAVTGGIGSGKSCVVEILRRAGYFTVSADEVAKKVMAKYSMKRKLKKLFPTCVSGVFKLKLDRKALSRIVFHDKNKLNELNGLTHPIVMKEIDKKAKHCGHKHAIIEVPLLFEHGFETRFDAVIVVIRELEERIESVIKRSSMTKREVVARIHNQFDYDNADLSNYYVIKNTGDMHELKKKTHHTVHVIFRDLEK